MTFIRLQNIALGVMISLAFYTNPLWAADCAQALGSIFKNEGGYQNFKNDGGNWSSKKVGVGTMCGGTKYGIACAYNPGVNIKALTKEQAASIYSKRECAELRISELNNQSIATLLLDLGVNMGTEMAIKITGTTINLVNQDKKPIVFDKVFTDEMVSRYNSYLIDQTTSGLFLTVLTLLAIDRYAYIVESNSKQATWLLGWIRRVIPAEIVAVRPIKSPD